MKKLTEFPSELSDLFMHEYKTTLASEPLKGPFNLHCKRVPEVVAGHVTSAQNLPAVRGPGYVSIGSGLRSICKNIRKRYKISRTERILHAGSH